MEDYTPMRRHASAAPLSLCLVEYILGIDLDHEVYEDKNFRDAYWAACDHICWANVSTFGNKVTSSELALFSGPLLIRLGAVSGSGREQRCHSRHEGK